MAQLLIFLFSSSDSDLSLSTCSLGDLCFCSVLLCFDSALRGAIAPQCLQVSVCLFVCLCMTPQAHVQPDMLPSLVPRIDRLCLMWLHVEIYLIVEFQHILNLWYTVQMPIFVRIMSRFSNS